MPKLCGAATSLRFLLTQTPDSQAPPSAPMEVTGEKFLQLQKEAVHLHFLVPDYSQGKLGLFICSPGAATPLQNIKIQFYIKKGLFYFFFLF